MEFKEYSISDLGKIVTGKTPSTKNKNNFGNKMMFLTPSDDMDSRYVVDTIRKLSDDGIKLVKNNIIPKNSICVSCIGSQLGKVVINTEDIVTNQQINSIIPNENFNYLFLYYLMMKLGSKLNFLSKNSTAVPIINKTDFSNIKVIVPDINYQNKIANVLNSYDKKIETNNKIIANLEAQAQALFKYYFIDYEPFADGNFVDSELGPIPEGWEVVKLGKIINILDSERIPLSKMERDGMEKNYPYYGANGIIDYVEDYIFDGTYLLMGEDGTVINEYNRPILNYVNGKVWVNNHAHVLTGKNTSTEYLYVLLSQTNIQKIVTGAVQLKINQTNLKSIRVVKPPEKIIDKYENFINSLFKEILTLTKQNQTLAQARDALLPRLMAGEIDLEGLGGSYD